VVPDGIYWAVWTKEATRNSSEIRNVWTIKRGSNAFNPDEKLINRLIALDFNMSDLALSYPQKKILAISSSLKNLQ
jgi:hypothetical protein